jgi:hypothetical protein
VSDGQLKDGTKGISIDTVEKSSPAAQAGLHQDDVIIGVNRNRVQSIAELRKVLESKPRSLPCRSCAAMSLSIFCCAKHLRFRTSPLRVMSG